MGFNKILRERIDKEFPSVDEYKKVMSALRSGEDVDYRIGYDDGEGPSESDLSYVERLKEGVALAREINGLERTEGYKEGD
ncbi:MAG: hypothetical protein IH978_08460 [Nitrospinae bacterium]|nr:hypothetical protein [Nitrospinota bacterium]